MPNYSINTLIRNLGAAQQGQSLSASAKAYPRQLCSFWVCILGCFGISKHYAEQDYVKEQGVKSLKVSVLKSEKITDLRKDKRPCENYKESERLLIENEEGKTFWVKLREIPSDDGTTEVQVVSDSTDFKYGAVLHTEKKLNFFWIMNAPA